MVLPKSKNAVGLGNSLMNDRFRKKDSNLHRGNAQQHRDITRTDATGNSYITPAKKEAEWMKMRSVTEQGALDEFLSTAELAGTDFTAEKIHSVKIIHTDQKNPYLLSREEERGVVRKQNAKRARLTVPRRPPWHEGMSKTELDERERESLLQWRRGLAELQEVDDLLLTPFERNIEVWRQLWRVIERSDLVVQIVDARNPLLFRCEDLERYVKEVDEKKRNLLLVNKADMMTEAQRRAWAEFFVEKGIRFRFFSAHLARELNEARYGSGDESEDGESEEDDEGDVLDEDDVEEEIDFENDTIAKEAAKITLEDQEEEDAEWSDEETLDSLPELDPEQDPLTLPIEEQTRILTTSDLEALFLQHSPRTTEGPTKTVIGLVGYPNVGKSSTINALLGSKRVSVSATPGKTKHFQTIHLSSRVILCDCPGLVFPNFATTKAELVLNGVLPIDQLREYTGPAALVAARIPKPFLETVYGMKIPTRPLEEGGTGIPTGEEMLRAYARARGFWSTGVGQPDESRAARAVFKDFVKGKLVFVHPPPLEPASTSTTSTEKAVATTAVTVAGGERERQFNRELYDLARLPEKSKRRTRPTPTGTDDSHPDMIPLPPVSNPPGAKSSRLDKQFFGPGQSNGVVVQPFHYKYTDQGRGKELSGRKFKTLKALEQNVDVADLKVSSGGKKHFKGNKRVGKGGKKGVGGGEDFD